ncbi:hypothetical protein ACFDTO_04005 [Microbacteriaceae bacterium 4G12]
MPKKLSPSVLRLVMEESGPALRTRELTGRGSVAPVPEPTAARPYPGSLDPFIEVKLPPSTSLVASGEITIDVTRPPAATGAQGWTAPSQARAAATPPGRCTPLTELKLPPK